MRIEKTIKGEKYYFYIQLIPDTMTVNVRYFQTIEPVIGKISEDFKWIILPDGYMSPYISGVGKVQIKKLKLHKHQQQDAREYNDKFVSK